MLHAQKEGTSNAKLENMKSESIENEKAEKTSLSSVLDMGPVAHSRP